MRRLLVALSVLLILPLSASAWMSPLVCGGGGQSASGCSTPTGDVMYESFGDDSTACTSGGTEACINTWTINGDSQTFHETLPGSPPSGSCTYGLLSDTYEESQERVYLDTGDAISYETSIDIKFPIYVDSASIDSGQKIYILTMGSNNNGSYNSPWLFGVYNDGSKIYFIVSGTAQATSDEISVDTWYTIDIHSDGTAANSYFTVNSGSQIPFTRYNYNYEYMITGSISSEGTGEGIRYYLGYIYANTP